MNDFARIQTIDDYFGEYSHFHVKKATELLQPLHTPGRDPLPDFSYATRQPFESQAHVIAAATKMLDETHRGMIVSEPGTGKTLMGMLTIHHHAQRSVRKGGCSPLECVRWGLNPRGARSPVRDRIPPAVVERLLAELREWAVSPFDRPPG
jgi:hypothetical protein